MALFNCRRVPKPKRKLVVGRSSARRLAKQRGRRVVRLVLCHGVRELGRRMDNAGQQRALVRRHVAMLAVRRLRVRRFLLLLAKKYA